MIKKPPRSVNDLLRSSPRALGSVLRQAAFLQEIEAVVHEGLPPEARDQVRVAACGNDRLVLLVGNAGWATRLRYQQNAIRRELARRMRRHVGQVEIRVRPMEEVAAPEWPRRQLSDSARKRLEAAARCVDNPELAAALRRLAKLP